MHKATLVFRKTPIKNNGIVGIGSYLIRKITGSKYDHAERLIGDYVYSGTQRGVRKMLYKDWQTLFDGQIHTEATVMVPYTEEQFLLLFEIFEGIRYDYWSLLMHLLYRVSGKWFGKGRDGLNALYCTEFIALASGIDQWFIKDVLSLEILAGISSSEKI